MKMKGRSHQDSRREVRKKASRAMISKPNTKRLTRGQAIKLFCLECMGYQGHRNDGASNIARRSIVTPGEAYEEVKKCGDLECPFHAFRLDRITIPGHPLKNVSQSIPGASRGI